jgi:hypothetical protein
MRRGPVGRVAKQSVTCWGSTRFTKLAADCVEAIDCAVGIAAEPEDVSSANAYHEG